MVGVVLVTYNGEEWVDACVSSILKSSIKVKLVIIDNHSTDKTITHLSRFDSENVVLKVMDENIGFGKANNVGIELLLTDEEVSHVYLINQDALLYPDTLEKLVVEFEKNDLYGILSPLHFNDSKSLELSFERWLKKSDINPFEIVNEKEPRTYLANFINAAHWMIPIRVIKEIGGFDPLFFVYGEDKNYVHRLHWLGYKLGVVSTCKAVHYNKGVQKKNRVKNALKHHYTTSLELLLNPNRTFRRCLVMFGKQTLFVWYSMLQHPRLIKSVFRDTFRIILNYNKIVNHRKLYDSIDLHFLST